MAERILSHTTTDYYRCEIEHLGIVLDARTGRFCAPEEYATMADVTARGISPFVAQHLRIRHTTFTDERPDWLVVETWRLTGSHSWSSRLPHSWEGRPSSPLEAMPEQIAQLVWNEVPAVRHMLKEH